MRWSGLQKFAVLVISNKKIQIGRGTWYMGVGMSVCLMEVEGLIGLSGEGVACTRIRVRSDRRPDML